MLYNIFVFHFLVNLSFLPLLLFYPFFAQSQLDYTNSSYHFRPQKAKHKEEMLARKCAVSYGLHCSHTSSSAAPALTFCGASHLNALIGNLDLPPVTKFSYLSSVLEGEAKQVIQELAVTSANYAHARTLLEKRFWRKERIVFAHIQALLSIQPLQTS